MSPEAQNAIDIAVIKEQINGLREQQKAHAAISVKQYEAVLQKLDEVSTDMLELKTSAKVGWRTICAIGALVVGIITLILAIAGYFKG